jgi:hypothetical protein
MQARALLCLLLVATAALAEAPPATTAGASLYTTGNCAQCHDTTVYTRPDRKVTTLAKLEGQIRACDVNLNLGWFDEDIAHMVTYLNQHYYHFKP